MSAAVDCVGDDRERFLFDHFFTVSRDCHSPCSFPAPAGPLPVAGKVGCCFPVGCKGEGSVERTKGRRRLLMLCYVHVRTEEPLLLQHVSLDRPHRELYRQFD